MTFKIVGKAQQFQNIFSACKVIIDEATVEVTDKALTFRGYDTSHIAMVDIDYPGKEFEAFHGSAKLGVRTEEIMKLLKCFDKEDMITLTLEDSTLVMSDGSKTFKNRLVDTTPSDMPLPKIKFEAKVEIGREVLQDALSDVAKVSEFVTMQVKDQNSFEVSGKGDLSSASLFPEYDNCSGSAKSVFGLSYITAILAAVTVDKVVLELADKAPCKLTMGHIRYYLAPRIQD